MTENEKIFIFGDIHGCLGTLKRLMDKIDWRPDKDRLIFLGDYVDRGKDSRGVIDFLLAISKISQSVDYLMGNHEGIFLDFLNHGNIRRLLVNGGEATLISYDIQGKEDGEPLIPHEHSSFLQALRPWIELEDYYVVHAGFRPGVEIERQTLEDLTWIRDRFVYSDYDFGKKVIFGHTPFSEPLVMDNKIGLDTGAVYGNRLTCLELPSLKFHSVESRISG